MAAPWVVCIAVEYAVFRMYFRGDLGESAAAADRPGRTVAVPVTSLVVLAVILVGLAVAPALRIESWVVAAVGAAVLAVRAVRRRRRTSVRAILTQTNPLFLVFVAALAVLVDAATGHGLQSDLSALLPRAPRCRRCWRSPGSPPCWPT